MKCGEIKGKKKVNFTFPSICFENFRMNWNGMRWIDFNFNELYLISQQYGNLLKVKSSKCCSSFIFIISLRIKKPTQTLRLHWNHWKCRRIETHKKKKKMEQRQRRWIFIHYALWTSHESFISCRLMWHMWRKIFIFSNWTDNILLLLDSDVKWRYTTFLWSIAGWVSE